MSCPLARAIWVGKNCVVRERVVRLDYIHDRRAKSKDGARSDVSGLRRVAGVAEDSTEGSGASRAHEELRRGRARPSTLITTLKLSEPPHGSTASLESEQRSTRYGEVVERADPCRVPRHERASHLGHEYVVHRERAGRVDHCTSTSEPQNKSTARSTIEPMVLITALTLERAHTR